MKKRKFLWKLGTLLICLGIAAAVLLACMETFIRPVLIRLLDYKCSVCAERLISTAVFDKLSDSEEYKDIITFRYDNDGRIAALDTDRVKINSLKALLTEAVNDGIAQLGKQTVSISLGTLTGISLFYDRGGDLDFRIEPRGKAETQLVSSFESTGINQTVHSIILEVTAQLSPMTPGFCEKVTVDYDILLAQTVIVGQVPESYSFIVLDQEHLSDIADIDIA